MHTETLNNRFETFLHEKSKQEFKSINKSLNSRIKMRYIEKKRFVIALIYAVGVGLWCLPSCNWFTG